LPRTDLKIHILYVDSYPGDIVLSDNRVGIADSGGSHRKIQGCSTLVNGQIFVGCPQIQIQIGGQHVVEQAGHGTSREFNVELSVGGKQRGRLIKVAVIPQHVLGITRAQGSEWVHGK
jgi:hypothetical protein